MEIQTSIEFSKLKNTKQLLQESWQIYQSKVKVLLVIMAILVGFNIFSDSLFNFLSGTDLKYSVSFSIILAIFSLVSLFLWLWAISSLIFAIKENIGIKEAGGKGLKILISYAWVYFLASALILGGFVFSIIPGFLLSIPVSIIFYFIPAMQTIASDASPYILVGAASVIIGILFSIWFSLSVFALIFEEKKGMDTVFRSSFLVSGNFWKVLWRFLLLGLIILIIFVFFAALFQKSGLQILNDTASKIISLFITPFILIYGVLVYKNLAEIKKETSYQKPSLAKKLKYALPGILGTIVIIFVIVILSLNIIWGRDERPTDDSDLRLSKIEIANEEENAFYWLAPWIGDSKNTSGKSTIDETISRYWPEGKERMKERKTIYLPSDKTKIVDGMIAGKIWDEELAKDLLEKNREMFDDFDKAANSPYFQDPIIANPDNINPAMLLFPVLQYRNIAKVELVKASSLFNQRREKEAFDEAIKVIRLGNLMKNSQGTLINYLFATTIKEMGLNRIRLMLPETNLSQEELRSYISQLEEMKDNGQGLAKVMKGEYASYNYYKKIIDTGFEGKLSKEDLEFWETEGGNLNYLQTEVAQRLSYLYKPNQTQRFNIEDARIRVNNATKEYYSEMNFNDEKINAVYSQINSMGPAIIFTENPIGKTFYSIGAVSLSGAFAKRISENFSIIATQTLMAMKAYKVDNSSLPASLNELVPKYLEEAPVDPYDGKPIRYSPEKKIIYSVGRDLKDSDGETNSEYGEKKKDDVSFTIDF